MQYRSKGWGSVCIIMQKKKKKKITAIIIILYTAVAVDHCNILYLPADCYIKCPKTSGGVG